jgi:hypothetical protein
MKKAPPTIAAKSAPPQMFRFIKMRGGTVAFSCFQICTARKADPRMAKRIKRTMILAFPQLYFEPPHCKASKRQMTPLMKKKVPSGSICASWPFQVVAVSLARGGEVKKKIMNKPVIAPNGKSVRNLLVKTYKPCFSRTY